ncbi:hypothetical protein ACLML9_25210, partial [Nocardia sp. NPDC002869]
MAGGGSAGAGTGPGAPTLRAAGAARSRRAVSTPTVVARLRSARTETTAPVVTRAGAARTVSTVVTRAGASRSGPAATGETAGPVATGGVVAGARCPDTGPPSAGAAGLVTTVGRPTGIPA